MLEEQYKYSKKLCRPTFLNRSQDLKIAIVVSHPIQHFCPQYESLSKAGTWNLKVFFGSPLGLAPYKDRNFDQEISWSNLKLDQFDHEFLNAEPLQSSRSLDAPTLFERLDIFDPDVVITYGYIQKLQRRARKWARQRSRFIYYISDTEVSNHKNKLILSAKTLALKYLFSRVDRVLSVGNSNEIFYAKCGIPLSKVTRMHFPIDRSKYEVGYSNKQRLRFKARTDLKINADDVVVSNVGKFVHWKRQKDLIEAVARLPESSNVKLVLIGSGPDEQTLRSLSQQMTPNRVIFTGFVSPEQLPALYAASDVYAHPASFEPHSLAISEAIFMGLPLILSETSGSFGPFDDLRPGRNGLLHPVGDVDSLANCISVLCSNAKLRNTFGLSSRSYAEIAQETAHQKFLTDALIADRLLSD